MCDPRHVPRARSASLWNMDPTRPTVLIVDDDASLRSALESVLTSRGYRVLTTGEPDNAYDLLAHASVDAVLIDVRLPTISGLALSLAIAYRWPHLRDRIAFMTADAGAPDVRTWLQAHHSTVFPKPFRSEQLAHWLDATLQQRDHHATGS
jgi:DNA-binding NtrC family response regulator